MARYVHQQVWSLPLADEPESIHAGKLEPRRSEDVGGAAVPIRRQECGAALQSYPGNPLGVGLTYNMGSAGAIERDMEQHMVVTADLDVFPCTGIELDATECDHGARREGLGFRSSWKRPHEIANQRDQEY